MTTPLSRVHHMTSSYHHMHHEIMMAASKKPRGGYSCEFVVEPAKELQTECSVCLQVLRQPNIVSCCGEKFCHTCIEQVIEEKKPCPHCNSFQFTSMADKKLQRELLELKVYCTNKYKGCEWVGDLKNLEKHCNASRTEPTDNCTAFFDVLEGCDYERIWCTKCEKEMQRSELNVHLSKGCDHLAQSAAEKCHFNYAGCNAKVASKDMKSHLEENVAAHLSLIMDLIRKHDGNVGRSEIFPRHLTEMEDRKVRLPTDQERREVVLRKQQGTGEVLLRPPPVRILGRSLILWVGVSLVVLFLSMILAVWNKDTFSPLGNFLKEHLLFHTNSTCTCKIDNFDHSGINLAALGDLVNDITKDVETLKRATGNNMEKIQGMAEDLRKLETAAKGWSTVLDSVEYRKLHLIDSLKQNLSTLSSDVANLVCKMEDLTTKEETQLLQQRLDTLTGLQTELSSLKLKIDNLPRPLSRDEITAIIVEDKEKAFKDTDVPSMSYKEACIVISAAINKGAPTYNSGDHIGCYNIYKQTAEKILGQCSIGGVQQKLRSALNIAKQQSSSSSRAWTMRHAFDAILDGDIYS